MVELGLGITLFDDWTTLTQHNAWPETCRVSYGQRQRNLPFRLGQCWFRHCVVCISTGLSVSSKEKEEKGR